LIIHALLGHHKLDFFLSKNMSDSIQQNESSSREKHLEVIIPLGLWLIEQLDNFKQPMAGRNFLGGIFSDPGT
jgi:hypothetical protein